MTVEVRGIWIPNRGSAMMLKAVECELAQASPGERIALFPPGCELVWMRKGFSLKLPSMGLGRAATFFGQVMPTSVRHALHIATGGDVRAVLDVSGFAYGDVWGEEKLRRRLGDYLGQRPSRVPLVLLPQAFGPFKNPALAADISRVVNEATLVYARDPESLNYLRGLVGNAPNLRLAPDFTTLLPATPSNADRGFQGRICIVPNSRMSLGKGMADVEAYLTMVMRFVEFSTRADQRPFILLHEFREDRGIAKRIIERWGRPIEVFAHSDPLRLKAVIGNASGVITSRFHALVSALSQGVPALSIGWSHKYDALLSDYGESQLSVDIHASGIQVESALAGIVEPRRNAELRARLLVAAQTEKARARAMWKEIWTVLDSGSS